MNFRALAKPGQFRNALAVCLLLSGIHSEPAAAGNPPGHPDRYLLVSYGSECCGTDREAEQKVHFFIARFERRHGVTLDSRKTYWGKEGEFDECLDLEKLPHRLAQELAEDLAETARPFKLVRISQQAHCRAPER